MRYVKCTEEFLAAANNAFEHSQTERNETLDFSDVINDITSALLSNHRVRFYIALGSTAPLLLCAFVSLHRRIEIFGLRIFCLNCVFVNFCYTLFLFVRLLAIDSWFIMKEQCYYKANRVPAIKYTETSKARGHFEFFLYRDLDKVTVYATSFPLVMVRLSVYRASVAHLPSSGENRTLWCIAVAAADVAAVVLGWLDSTMYGPLDVDFRIRLGLPIVTLIAIWIAETVLSTLSLITIAKMKLAKKSFTSSQKNNVSQMISFILFSIFPSILLAPHVYTGLNSVIDEWTTQAVWQCIGDNLVGNNTDFGAVSKECGLEDEMASVDYLYVNMLLGACQTLNVFKPYVEAFMLLFLLSNFRSVLFSYMRKLTGHANSRVERSVSMRPPKTNTVSTSLPASRRQSVWQ